jgi:hypothetical protein
MATSTKLLIFESWEKFIQTLFEILKSKSCTKDTRYRTLPMTLEIQVLALDNHKNVAGLNRLMGSPLPLLIIESPMTI